MRRVTAREFQKRFQRFEEPVLVNDGIWFPKATADLMAIAEGRPFAVIDGEDMLYPQYVLNEMPMSLDEPVKVKVMKVMAVGTTKDAPFGPITVKPDPVRPFSKTDQVKGRTRK